MLASRVEGQWTGSCDQGGRPATRATVATAAVAGNLALYAYFKKAWWSGARAPNWFMKEDWDMPFRDQDKFGHVYGGYHLTQLGDGMLRASCVSDRKAIAWAAVYATLFQLQIEVWDGYYEAYGFSRGDVVANATGTAFAVGRRLSPTIAAVRPSFSYMPTQAFRRRKLPGHNRNPRATTDYSGQTYWLSVDIDTLLPPAARARWPDFLRVSVGHSITDWTRPEDGAVLRARRKLLLSLDLDASKLPGNHPLWRGVKRQLAHYHFPAPALQLTPSLTAIAWYR